MTSSTVAAHTLTAADAEEIRAHLIQAEIPTSAYVPIGDVGILTFYGYSGDVVKQAVIIAGSHGRAVTTTDAPDVYEIR